MDTSSIIEYPFDIYVNDEPFAHMIDLFSACQFGYELFGLGCFKVKLPDGTWCSEEEIKKQIRTEAGTPAKEIED